MPGHTSLLQAAGFDAAHHRQALARVEDGGASVDEPSWTDAPLVEPILLSPHLGQHIA